MREDQLFVFLLLLSPTLASADDGKHTKWWSTPIIIVVYIGFFLLAALVALCIRHFRDHQQLLNYRNNQRMREGLDAEEIESLPSLRYSEMKMQQLKDKGDQQLECAVCLSEFKDQEVLRILPDCLHVFHPSCIAPWLASHLTCPICRSSLEHRQGSSVSTSSIFDSMSGPMSQRFGHSGYHHHDDDDDSDDDNDNDDDRDRDRDRDHVTIEIIEGSSTLHSEMIDLEGPIVTSDESVDDITKLRRSNSTGDLVGKNSTCTIIRSTSWSSLFPKESSTPKIDYHSGNISPAKSDSSINYSSLMLLQLNTTMITAVSASNVTSVSEL